MTSDSGTKPARNYNLDMLRGLAAVCVAYSHLILKMHNRGETDVLTRGLFSATKVFLDVGKLGVIVLFALGGYFILSSLQNAARRYQRPLTAFLLHRFFHLYPAYWLSLLFGVLLPWDDPGRIFPAEVVAINATMLQGFFLTENVMGLYWTLQINLTFYAICALLFLVGRAGDLRVVTAATVAFFVFAALISLIRYKFGIKMPVALPLMVGVCFLASLWKASNAGRDRDKSRYAWIAIGAFYALLLPICLLAYSHDYGFEETWYRYTISYGTGMTIFLAVSAMKRPLLNRLSPLGSASYTIFLCHPSVYAALDRIGFTPTATSLPPSVILICSVLCAIASGLIIDRVVLKPVFAWGESVVSAVSGRHLNATFAR
ncbi:acyltransferase family protein [Agrobacterium sp. NPDC089420]|uniref:acyltransferase family protein n=1 Tax=Agrobacterium sp. NPDC089420 TaxID=3363918 RepID=UPI00385015C7